MSKPFILYFAEKPILDHFEQDLIEYSKELNLNVIKGTDTPAISYSMLETETFTKAEEDADTDRGSLEMVVDTFTETRVVTETSDSDLDNSFIRKMIDTATLTEVKIETTDSDPT